MENMNNILNSLETIKMKKDDTLNFQFDKWLIELDNIEYSSKCRTIICKNFEEWLERDRYKTFPKKKNKWLNIFKTHNNICEIKIELDINTVLNNLKSNKVLSQHYKDVYNGIRNYINNNSFNFQIPNNYMIDILKEYCLHINYFSEQEIFNILFENGYLLINSKNEIIINESILNTILLNKSKFKSENINLILDNKRKTGIEI